MVAITSAILYGAGICQYFRGQDGRVVKASFFCEIAMVTRGFETRLQILSSKKSLWYVAMVAITSAILYGAGICRYFRGQDGRVAKASFFCEIAMVTRGFETRL